MILQEFYSHMLSNYRIKLFKKVNSLLNMEI